MVDPKDLELQKANAEIERLQTLLERERCSSQAEVQGMRKEVQKIERERIEYLQNVSHQIVAPLNAMKWHIENLTEARVSIDRAKRVLRSIYSQATIAVHLELV